MGTQFKDSNKEVNVWVTHDCFAKALFMPFSSHTDGSVIIGSHISIISAVSTQN